MKKKYIIAIDGPAGAGKSTVAKMLAEKLHYLYLDSGAMYRALTWKAMQYDCNMRTKKKLLALAKDTTMSFRRQRNSMRLYMDGKVVGEEIRTPEVTKNIRFIADNRHIRTVMVALQRKAGEKGGVVMEGRDIGTKVFPEADFKFYLDAGVRERALRRFREYKSKGVNIAFRNLMQAIRLRDEQDTKRKVSPLLKSPDSVCIRTTDINVQQVVKKIIMTIKSHRKRR